ncbi:MAG: hypothetical protein KAS51_07370 [Candidatus Omnitrophica bacterium]|nr:hypothetical protein [Candidatus Omnitrophota bacterium]
MKLIVGYKLVVIFGSLVSLLGVYKLYCAIKPDTNVYSAAPGEKPLSHASLDYDMAKEGVRYIIYGLLAQMILILI